MSSETEGSQAKLKNKEIVSEEINKNPAYKKLDVETKIYIKTAQIMHKCGIDYSENNEVIKSFIEKLKGLFSAVATHHQLEALEFVIAGKPRDMIEVHHLLNLFTVSDYMRIINTQLHSGKIHTHEQNQEYIRLSGKIMEQYSKGMLSFKMYREGLPQCNKVQNNTLNQVNINKMEAKPRAIEQNDGLKVEEIAIKTKEEL
jgi:hypothetical protein